MLKEVIYINNRFVNKKDAKVSVFDHGFLYGDGIFETMRSYNCKIFKLNEHLNRLYSSARKIGLKLPWGKKSLERKIKTVFRKAGIKNATIRISVTRGEGKIGLSAKSCRRPTLVIVVKLVKRYPKKFYQKGVNIIISSYRKIPSASLDPSIKSNNYLNSVLARIEADKKRAFETIMLNEKGNVAEGTVSNIFVVRNGMIFTPALNAGILNGITRRFIINIAKRSGLRVKEGNFKSRFIVKGDECFLTNTSMEIMPVRKCNGKLIGGICPGTITKELAAICRKSL